MMRSIGFDHVIDYRKEDFTKNGQRYDLILDTKTGHSPFECARSLNPGGAYATVAGEQMGLLFQFLAFGWWIRLTKNKTVRLIKLRQNKDLLYLNERFEAGELVGVIDSTHRLSAACEVFRHYGSANFKGKVVITMP